MGCQKASQCFADRSLLTAVCFCTGYEGYENRGAISEQLHLNVLHRTLQPVDSHYCTPIIHTGTVGTIMAPISSDFVGLAITQQPEAAFISMVILFVASIALLVLCASCKKHSFDMNGRNAPEEKPSTLVSVARVNESAGRHNPSANEITSDEIEGDANIEVSEDGMVYKPWRSHTLTLGSNLEPQVNGDAGTTTKGS
ncbi:hypothetical protein DNTS_010248 [Danionella cerebrum]|uniref:Uncharacterized protein n=1 Tax=Danionella cerebrum TaxID=2873325 RepID=A0A553P5J0_9TELE|nr:hypothetical protein DNTS_010248 [Danionella translucida]